MSRLQAVEEILRGMGQSTARIADFLQVAGGDPAMAAKLLEAAQNGDNRAILKLMAENQWGKAPARAMPAPQEPTGSRSPLSFEQRLANDPNVRRRIEAGGERIPPDVRARAMRGDPDAVSDVYTMREPAGDAVRQLLKPETPQEGIARQFDQAIDPARQMELPFREPEVARGTPGPLRTTDDFVPDEPPIARPRTPAPEDRRIPGWVPPAVAGGAAGLGMMLNRDEPAVESGGESDLAAETKPPPEVPAAPEPEGKPAEEPDYSLQARELINKLNAMRRAAGGEVPEARAMMAEIDRLIAMGNEQRKKPAYSYPARDPARDPYQQARDLLAKVNELQASGVPHGSPQVQALMAQIRKLQAEGDAIRNRRSLPSEPSRGVRPGYNATLPGRPTGGPGLIRGARGLRQRSSPSTT